MDTHSAPDSGADHPAPSAPLDFLTHPALCQLALPMRASKGPWSRDVGTASVSIDMGETGLSLPSGKFLRLVLLAVLDAAARHGDARVEMGAASHDFAARLGLQFNPAQQRGLAEQLDRLVAARMMVSLDGGLPFSVFDGRSRPAQDATGWRPALKLNAKFLAQFRERAIPLPREAALALWEQPTALDAFAALAFVSAELPPGEAAMTGWDDLLARFGTKGQDLASFRTQFEADLAAVRPHAPNLGLIAGDEGVEIRMLASAPAPKLAPLPVPAPVLAPEPTPPVEQTLEEALSALPEPDAPESLDELPEPAPLPTPIVEAAAPTPAVTPADESPHGSRRAGRVMALKSHLTGLQQVIWLQRSQGRGDPLVEVTPGGRYDPAVVTVLALEPVVVQIAGGLYQRDFDRVSSWTMANRDLIDDFWFDDIDDMDAITARVKRVPAPGWRE